MTRDSGDVGYSPDQQMKMLRHDHAAANDYVVFDADFFQDFQEQVFTPCGREELLASIAGTVLQSYVTKRGLPKTTVAQDIPFFAIQKLI